MRGKGTCETTAQAVFKRCTWLMFMPRDLAESKSVCACDNEMTASFAFIFQLRARTWTNSCWLASTCKECYRDRTARGL